MKKIICILSIAAFLLGNPLPVCANDGTVSLDNSYVEGIITESDVIGLGLDGVDLRVYSFQINEPGKINLHFITHIETIKFEIRDVDENIIKEDYLYENKSPYDYPLTLGPGVYTLHIIGSYGCSPGDYKFKMEMQPIVSDDKINSDSIEDIVLNQMYIGYFSSQEEQMDVEKKYNFDIIESGKYFLRIEPEIDMAFSVRDVDENEIESGYVYEGDKYEVLLEMDNGRYTLINTSKDAGQYTFGVSKEEIEVIGDDETTSNSKSLLDKIFSPATFFGAILVAVIGGVIVAIIVKHFKLS